MKHAAILIVLTFFLAACQQRDCDPPAGSAGRFGTAEASRQSLLETDRAFFGTLHDADAFRTFLAPDVYMLAPGTTRVQGPGAFRSAIEDILRMPGMNLSWAPELAKVATDGSLGYTIGAFAMTMDGPDGEPVSRTGKYKTSWARQDDGRWRVVADMFNFDAPVPQEPAD